MKNKERIEILESRLDSLTRAVANLQVKAKLDRAEATFYEEWQGGVLNPAKSQKKEKEEFKENDPYWCYDLSYERAEDDRWTNHIVDIYRRDLGNTFRTKEEAEAFGKYWTSHMKLKAKG